MSNTKSSSKKVPESITDKAREIWLAGLGVFSTVEEEGGKLFNKFIERGRELEARGETFEKKAKDRVDSLTAYVTERTSKLSGEVSTKFSESMPAFLEEKFQNTLETFGLPSRSEVKALSEKVDKLVETVEKLTKEVQESGRKTTPKPPKG